MQELFKHTVFANDFKMLIDKRKEDIEYEIDYIYKKAVEKSKDKKKLFILIYYSGEGCIIMDRNREPSVPR